MLVLSDADDCVPTQSGIPYSAGQVQQHLQAECAQVGQRDQQEKRNINTAVTV